MAPLLQINGIVKSFPGVSALNGVSLDLEHGEVHCLVGENGAGKSTLIKILVGMESADEGQILLEGSPVVIRSTQDALRLGIAYVPQELTLMPEMTVAENIFMGRMPTRFRFGLPTVDYKSMKAMAQDIVHRVGLEISVDIPVKELGPADMQLCQIARALFAGGRVIILDEPTASLGAKETERLFDIVQKLCKEGVAFIYVTHRLDEIPVIGNRISVLRDGNYVGTYQVSEVNKAQIIQLMVGSKGSELYQKAFVNPEDTIGEIVLKVDGLTKNHVFRDISFTVSAGEIVGIFGLVGAGRTDVVRALMGLEPVDGGTVEIFGRHYKRITPAALTKQGVALVPEERRQQALALEQSVRSNLSMASIKKITQRGILSLRRETSMVREIVSRLLINSTVERPVRLLSGGTQQKVVIGRWLMADSRLFLIDEPTRGIDIGARSEIYRLMEGIVTNGGGIVMVSSDIEEILGISDRVLVMKGGRIVGTFHREDATAEVITACAFG